MRWIQALLARFGNRQRFEQELDVEVREYFEELTERHMARGLPPEEARRAARLRFDNPERVKEKVRDAGMGAGFETALRDVRYALRAMAKSPGFAAIAMLTLALGIGASTAIFTIVDSVLLKPLTYRESGSLVVASERVRLLSSDPTGPNPRHADLWQQRSTAFSGMALIRQNARGLAAGTEHPSIVGTVLASPNLFTILRTEPVLGRAFLSSDGVLGQDHVAILTWPLWQREFRGDRNVIGRVVRLAETPYEVVGVLPENFRFPNANALRAFRSKQGASSVPEPAIFVPAALDLNGISWNGDYGNWVALGRLRPGIAIRQAEAQLNGIEGQIVQDMPLHGGRLEPGSLQVSLQPMQEAVVGETRTGLVFLFAAVLGLMLIACVNLAGAQLGRALSRDREAAVRSALGASGWQLVRSSLVESILLAAAGGTAGVFLAIGALALFRRYSPVDVPRLAEIQPNITVLFFAMALTLAVCLLFGSMPALRFFRTDPQSALQKGNVRNVGGRQSRAVRTWLVGLQVFGCTVLLLITGLFSKSLLLLLHNDKGFDAGSAVVAEVRLSPQTYGSDQSRIGFNDAVLAGLRQLPGVRSAGLVSAMPLEGESWIEQLQRTDKPELQAPLLNLRWVSPGYFETMRERLVAGRFFEERDRSLSNAVLSENLAKAVWRNENPIGGEIKIEGRKFTVIGVAGDSRTTSLKSSPANMAYVHYKDRPPYVSVFIVRGAQSAEQLIAGVRETIWNRAPGTAIARVKTLDSQVRDSVAAERFQTGILLAFGCSSLLLAMLGIYGMLSYSVSGRKQEIGVRMAMGATRKKIYALTFGEAAVPVFAGLTAGLVSGVIAGRAVAVLLYGTQPIDLPIILMVTVLFAGAAMAAAFLPARRAARLDPVEVLRTE